MSKSDNNQNKSTQKFFLKGQKSKEIVFYSYRYSTLIINT